MAILLLQLATVNSSTPYTQYPDGEDLNRDNTMNEAEEYFQYKVDIKPGMTANNTQYITDVRNVPVNLANGQSRNETLVFVSHPYKSVPVKSWQYSRF